MGKRKSRREKRKMREKRRILRVGNAGIGNEKEKKREEKK